MSDDLILVVESQTLDDIKDIPHFRDCRTVADDSDEEDDYIGSLPEVDLTPRKDVDTGPRPSRIGQVRTPKARFLSPKTKERAKGSTSKTKSNDNNNINSTLHTDAQPLGNGVKVQEQRPHSTDSVDRFLNKSKKKLKEVLLINESLIDLIPPEPDEFDIQLDKSIIAAPENSDCDSVSCVSSENSFYTCIDESEPLGYQEQPSSINGCPGTRPEHPEMIRSPTREAIQSLPKPLIYKCTKRAGKCQYTTSDEGLIESHRCPMRDSSPLEARSHSSDTSIVTSKSSSGDSTIDSDATDLSPDYSEDQNVTN